MKTYTKFGKQFRISSFPKKPDSGIPYFSEREFAWIQDHKPPLTDEQFSFLHQAKINDWTYEMVTDTYQSDNTKSAMNDCLSSLGLLKKKEPERPSDTQKGIDAIREIVATTEDVFRDKEKF